MPRPSLSEVLDGLWLHASHILRPVMGEQSSEYVAMAEDYTDLRSRLTALETELEEYRKRERCDCDVCRVHEDLAELGDAIARDNALLPAALPCSSAFLNAHSDITGEELD